MPVAYPLGCSSNDAVEHLRNAADLQHWLADPGGIKPGNQMAQVVTPGMLTTQQKADLSAYLENLK
ncbi:MAG: hypothetical protein ACHQ7M_13505 [Chloroflexota bacterium]